MKNSKVLFHGSKFDVEVVDVTTTSGKKASYDIVVHRGSVVLLPILNSDEIILIQNERYAVGKKLWELPAGTLEKGERPLLTAMRELEEETGYVAKKMEPLLSFYASPGYSSELLHVFVAKELTKTKQKLDETEKIEVHAMKMDRAVEMIQKGEIIDAKTIAALLYYSIFGARAS